MRYALSVLILPAFLWLPPALAQDNEAEKLFRDAEKKIKAATAIQVDVDMSMEGKGVKFKGSLLLTKDHKAKVTMTGQVDGKEFKVETISNGTRMRTSQTFLPDPKESETPKQFHNMLSAMTSRVGLVGIFFISSKKDMEKETDVEKLIPISEFKLEAAEKVGGRDAKVISYQAAPAGEKPARITLWLDAKTLLPLKRVIAPPRESERITETYTEFKLNPKVDAKVFELTK
ncbi:MAG TPA: hypothetical protein VEL76_27100 [Gemmataceae bacterium]|nr:hypothetical protein [Gemmataceae bacterium]